MTIRPNQIRFNKLNKRGKGISTEKTADVQIGGSCKHGENVDWKMAAILRTVETTELKKVIKVLHQIYVLKMYSQWVVDNWLEKDKDGYW